MGHPNPRTWLIAVVVPCGLVFVWAVGQLIESSLAAKVSSVALGVWAVVQLAVLPVAAETLRRAEASTRTWIILLAIGWLHVLMTHFFALELQKSISLFVLLVIPAVWLSAILSSLLAFRAAYRLPSVALALVIVAAAFGVPAATVTISMGQAFNATWYRLNGGRLAHLVSIANGPLRTDLEGSSRIDLPPEFANLSLHGKASLVGQCGDEPALLLPQFVGFISGREHGYVHLSHCEPADVDLRDDLGDELVPRQRLGGGWWWAE